jgi:hypothetical protein
MPPPLVRRVEILEEHVDALRHLPGQVSAIGADVVALRADVVALRVDVTELREALSDGRGGLIKVGAEFAAIRHEIRAGDEETRRQMRVLHEDVIARIALLQEGTRPARRNRDRASGTRRRKHR